MSAHPFAWKPPDYEGVYQERAARLQRIRAKPESLPALKAYYADHIAEFINDWGITSDPRARNRSQPVEMPFVLFERQKEMLAFIQERMLGREPGLIEKSRDCGASWLAMCFAASLCLFGRGVVVGVGSRTEDKVDRTGDPDCLLWKARFFLKNLPPEFRGGWDETRHSAHMRLQFPETGSAVVGEAGDAIGRGGRSTLYLIDEAAFIERPQLIEASLASNTDCRVDISTPNGRANSFATKRHSGRIPVFTFPWRADPRKDQAWYERQCELLDPVTRAQEIDLSYDASVEGILIPAEWVHAAIGAHTALGLEVTGARRGALDVADEGKDKCAFLGRHGILLQHLKSWSGKNSDIYRTTVKAFGLCEEYGYPAFDFDADGLGAGVRGDAVQINFKRREAGKTEIEVEAFRGSGAVFDGEGSLVEGRLNRDYFQNLKSQSWWALRLRFQNTYRAVVEKLPFDADGIISIDADLDELTNLVSELSQPTYSVNQVGKIVVDKTPEGAASPNLADSVMISYSPFRTGAYFSTVSAGTSSGAKVQALPSGMDSLYTVISFFEDTAAVVHCAANRPDSDGTRGAAFFILDWDLDLLDANVEEWMQGVTQRLTHYHSTVGGKMAGEPRIFCDDFVEGYAELLRQMGFATVPIGEQLPPIPERFNQARPYLNVGQVLIAQPAHQREVTYHGARRNFLREVLSQSEVQESNTLAVALATAILLNFAGRDAVPNDPQAPAIATPSSYRAAQLADLVAWDAEAKEAIAAIRLKIGDPLWHPRSLLAIGIRPRPIQPGLPIA
jgi:phage terminase large subunit